MTAALTYDFKSVPPRLPARIHVSKPEKKPVTVVLNEEDFGLDEVAYIGLSVTVNVNIPMSVKRKILGLGLEASGENVDPKQLYKTAFESLDLISTEVLMDWNLDDGETILPFSALQDFGDDVFQAVMKAVMKGLSGKAVSPN